MYEYLVLVLTKRNTEIADLNHLSLGFPASQFLQFVQQGQNFFVLGQQIQNAILRRDRIPIIHGVRMTYSTHASFFYVSEYGFRSESNHPTEHVISKNWLIYKIILHTFHYVSVLNDVEEQSKSLMFVDSLKSEHMLYYNW